MPYPPLMVRPMREELTRFGVQELMNAEEVDAFMEESKDKTALLVVNSVCGCAAGSARPGVAMALQSETKPMVAGSVFAGQDLEATAKARSFFADIPPSSPCVALFANGELVHFVPRHHIEGRDAETVAQDLAAAFTEHCS
jgi:putative YphP/YqiW family bacilliredoxin